MDEEIDLRPYIELLIRRWYLIVGAAVLVGLIAYGVTSQQERFYEATALITVTQDRLVARFDPRLDTSDEPHPLKALPELSISDDMVKDLLDTIDPPIANIKTISGLRGILEAAPGSDPSLIRLTATNTNAEDAARISNQWAILFVNKANELFGDGDGEQLSFFEDQRTQAEEELAATETALITFQGVNPQTILSNKVDALNAMQQTLLAEQQELNQLESNVQDLRDQITETDGGRIASFADQLTALVLQLRVYNPSLELPLQLQLDGTSGLSGITPDEQVGNLEELQETAASRLIAIAMELSEFEPQLLDLQEDLQKAQSEYSRLMLNRDVAQETYRSLARKVDEERITADDMARGIRLASEAAVPEKPEGSRRVFVVVGAAAAAGLTAIILLAAYKWWKEDSEGA